MGMNWNRKFHFYFGILYILVITIDLCLIHEYEKTLRNLVYLIVFYGLLLAIIAYMRISCLRKKYTGCATCGGILHFVTGIGALGMRIGLYVSKAASRSTSGTEEDRPTPNAGIIAFGPIYLVMGIISFIGAIGSTATHKTASSTFHHSTEPAVIILPTRAPVVRPLIAKVEDEPQKPPVTKLDKSETQLLRETDMKLERLQKEAEIMALQREMERIKREEEGQGAGAPGQGPGGPYGYPPPTYPVYPQYPPYAPEGADPYYGQTPGYPTPTYQYPAPPPPAGADVVVPQSDIS